MPLSKEELLQELNAKISSGEITQEEIRNLPDITTTIQQTNDQKIKKSYHFSITRMLYILGTTIVTVGVFIFISQIWNNIESFGRITITLGLGLLMAAMGSILLKQKPNNDIGPIFHFIGGVLIPGGAIVTLNEIGGEPISLRTIAIILSIISSFYGLLSIYHKHPILTFFAIINGTMCIYALVGALIEESYVFTYTDISTTFANITMIIGAMYLLLANTFRKNWNKSLVGLLYFFGSGGFLGAAFSRVLNNDILWEMLYVIIIPGGLLLSIYMKSRTILIMSTLFLIAYIAYITRKHFANSLGWPFALVMIGFSIIGLAYASITINKKYIKNNETLLNNSPH